MVGLGFCFFPVHLGLGLGFELGPVLNLIRLLLVDDHTKQTTLFNVQYY